MEDEGKRLKWQNLSGEERYRVVELMRRGQVEIKELCRTFGVSRQTLYRAAEAADRAASEALGPKPRGRRPEPADRKQLRELEQQKTRLQKQLHRMSQRYEVARTLLELQRKAERGEPLLQEKKTLQREIRPRPGGPGRPGRTPGMADRDGSTDTRDQDGGPDLLDPPPGRRDHRE